MYCDLWSQYIQVRKLFKGGNCSRAETICGNTVRYIQQINCKALIIITWARLRWAAGESDGVNLVRFSKYFLHTVTEFILYLLKELKLFLSKWKVNICDCQGYVSLLYIASALLLFWLWKGLIAWFSAVCTCIGAGASYTEWSLFFFVTLSYCHSA